MFYSIKVSNVLTFRIPGVMVDCNLCKKSVNMMIPNLALREQVMNMKIHCKNRDCTEFFKIYSEFLIENTVLKLDLEKTEKHFFLSAVKLTCSFPHRTRITVSIGAAGLSVRPVHLWNILPKRPVDSHKNM